MLRTFRVEPQVADRPPVVIEVEPLGEGRFRIRCAEREQVLSARRLGTNAQGVATWSLVPEGGGPQQLIDVEGELPELRLSLPSGEVLALRLDDARAAALAAEVRRPAAGPQQVRAPMPGKVVKILCRPGDRVRAGQGLLLIEAMKMENELRAPADGVVVDVRTVEGQSVEGGAVLVTLQ
ncbi:MAG: acetyl-CoA carboxylase biotin carboxyl carrier protein subunit [Myxococcales bacterium]|nr:acetyl-CoA carboxylase biotin carboxyl carrier protein subunit [Myxococcales bacterium]